MFGTDYYISNSGNDSNTGTSPESAWLTIAKVNSQMALFQPGDNIFFERGSIFRGTLEIKASGTSSSPISFSAYGTGDNPLLKGSKQISGLSRNGNIWSADCGECPEKITNLFIDGTQQPLSRYPNNEYLTITSGIGRNVIIDNDLNAANGYWNNSEVAVKSARWVIDVANVASQVGTTINLDENLSYGVSEGYGYFFQNHINAMDINGEWAHDMLNNRIQIYSENDLNNRAIEISVQNNCIWIENQQYISIQNLHLSQSREISYLLEDCNYINFSSNIISYSGGDAINSIKSHSSIFDNNTIQNTNNNGIVSRYSNDGIYTNNSLSNTAIIPGRGNSGNGNYIAIYIRSSENNLIEYNEIDKVGYNGISFFYTSDTEVKNNFVNYACMIKDDGGGIYTWGNQGNGNQIIGNIVLNSLGTFDGTDRTDKQAVGIYVDGASKYVIVENNTTAFCGQYGIYNHGDNIIISNNTSYENAFSQLGMVAAEVNGTPLIIDKCDVKNNYFFATGKYQQWVMYFEKIAGVNKYENNVLCDPYDPQIIRDAISKGNSKYYTIDDWQELGHLSDKPIPLTFAQSGLPDTTGFIIFDYNPSKTTKTRSLSGTYRDLDNNLVSGIVEIAPYSSIILLKEFRSILGTETTPSGQMEFCQGSQNTTYSTVGTTLADTYSWQLSPVSAGSINSTNLKTISIDWDPLYSGIASISYMASGPNNFKGLSPPLQVNILPKPHQLEIPNGLSSLFQNAPQSDYTTIEIEDATSYDWKINPSEAGRLFPFGNTCGVEWNEPFFGTAYVSVRAENDCGLGLFSDSLKIQVQEAELAYGIINIFTPNGDGFNDYWSIPFIRDFPDATVKIFDRSNRLLIEYNGLDSSWNGTINGELVPMGSYLYVIDLKTGKPPIKGYVTVLR